MRHFYLFMLVLGAGLVLACSTVGIAQSRSASPVSPAPKPDLLVARDGTQREVKVIEIADQQIVYRAFKSTDGPLYRVQKADYSFVQYGSSGEIERFTPKVAQAAAPAYATPANTPAAGYPFQKGDKVAFFGIGLQTGYTPVGIGLEYGVAEGVGLAAGVSYARISEISFFQPAISLYGHLGKPFNIQTGKTDPYIGLSISKLFATDGTNSVDFDVAGTAFLGLRQYLTDRVGIFGTLSIGVVNATGTSFGLGAALRIRQ